MSSKHQDKRYQRLAKELRPKLEALLPMPCPRCGRPMVKGMKLDLGHRTRDPQATYERSNLRLEHRRCNRQDGQKITTAMRVAKGRKGRPERPAW